MNGYIYREESSLKFDSKTLSIIEKDLNNLNLDFNSKFICLTIRDDAYLKETYQEESGIKAIEIGAF